MSLAATCFLTACGGGDDSSGGNNNNGSNNTAPSTLAAKSYDLNDGAGGGTTVVSFASPTRYVWQAPGAALENGDWAGSSDGTTWTVGMTTDTGGAKTLRMTFNSGGNGSYVISRTGLPDQSGSFSARSGGLPGDTATGGDSNGEVATDGDTNGQTDGSNNSSDNGSTDGGQTSNSDGSNTDGTNGSSDGTTSAGPSDEYIGNAPVSLHARTLYGTRTYTSTGPVGQTHTYTFNGNMFHDSDPPEESDGVYTYSASNSRATLTLDYTSPEDFANDHHQIDMRFTQRDRGTFTSTYVRGDGTTITINGEFELAPIQ